jgi:16S rRNA (cytosine967-C5)-methyltransferase
VNSSDARSLALQTLLAVHKGAFTDIALDRTHNKHSLPDTDRRFLTELVYGCVRRLRTLDTLIDQLAKKPAHKQPPELRATLHLGLYQLRYLTHIPPSAAVNTTVGLAKANKFSGLSGFVNGLLRQYLRLSEHQDPLQLPTDPIQRLGMLHSYPDWIVETWIHEIGLEQTEQLCIALNQPPTLDLRINPLKCDRPILQQALLTQGIESQPLPHLPQSLRLLSSPGSVRNLPGYAEGWWMVQDASAQLVAHVVNPHPGATVLDLCAAPGGKTTHLAELMQDQGEIWACDRTASRLRKVQQNCDRLQIQSIHLCLTDSRTLPPELPMADYVLVDAPCSGLGTLHRHADARWRQTPDTVQELAQLQGELLTAANQKVKPGGVLVYSTCTLHPKENLDILTRFLETNPDWTLENPEAPASDYFAEEEGYLTLWPHRTAMDGFFIARLRHRKQ